MQVPATECAIFDSGAGRGQVAPSPQSASTERPTSKSRSLRNRYDTIKRLREKDMESEDYADSSSESASISTPSGSAKSAGTMPQSPLKLAPQCRIRPSSQISIFIIIVVVAIAQRRGNATPRGLAKDARATGGKAAPQKRKEAANKKLRRVNGEVIRGVRGKRANVRLSPYDRVNLRDQSMSRPHLETWGLCSLRDRFRRR